MADKECAQRASLYNARRHKKPVPWRSQSHCELQSDTPERRSARQETKAISAPAITGSSFQRRPGRQLTPQVPAQLRIRELPVLLLVMLLVVFAAAVLPAGGLPPAICLQLFHA